MHSRRHVFSHTIELYSLNLDSINTAYNVWEVPLLVQFLKAGNCGMLILSVFQNNKRVVFVCPPSKKSITYKHHYHRQ